MYEQFERTRLLFGREAMEKLAASRVAVFGIGGVGGYVVEALARCGVGAIDLIDNDKVAHQPGLQSGGPQLLLPAGDQGQL